MLQKRLLAALAASAVVLAGCRDNPFAKIRPEGYAFPEGFQWGVAIAAHQAEGGNDRNDWWAWEQQAGRIKGGDKSGDAVGFAKVFDQDFKLARDLGQNAFRTSIEWSRIEPERGKYDAKQIKLYHDMFAAMRRHGLRPNITLMHFTLPNWVAAGGGWENKATADDFAAYAAFCAREFGAEVDDWVTINEPNSYAFKSYDEGTWPPGKKDRPMAVTIMGNQMVGHARAAKAVRQHDTAVAHQGGKAASVGLVTNVVYFEPWNSFSPIDQIRASVEDQVWNIALVESLRTGRFVAEMPGVSKIEVADPDLAGSADFLGVNYYRRLQPSGMSEYRIADNGQRNDLDWEIYPDGIFRLLERLKQQQLPLYVTENGTPDKADTHRAKFVVQHLMRVWQAIDAGIPVKGYFYWSLMDNFEWAEGFDARFGLYKVDFASSHTSRELTKGGEVYGQIARSNKLSADLIRQYGQ